MQVTATTQSYTWVPSFDPTVHTTTLLNDKTLYSQALQTNSKTLQLGYTVTATANSKETLGKYQKPDRELQPLCRQAAYFTQSPNRWVLGHLLNGVIAGGEGIAENLFPITKATNSHHLHQVETYVKDAVTSASTAFPVTYTVQANPVAGKDKATPLDPYGSFLCTATDKHGNGLLGGSATVNVT